MKKFKLQLTTLNYFNKFVGFFVLLSIANSSFAQDSEGIIANTDILTGYDDNLLRTVDKKSDRYIGIAPKIKLNALYGKHNFSASYLGDFRAYSNNDELNYSEHNLDVRALFDHSMSFNTEVTLFYRQNIEQPGVNNIALASTIDEFESFENSGVRAKFYYGTRESVGQMILSVGSNSTNYENDSQSFRNVDRNNITGTFFYNVGSNTRLLIESSYEDFDHTDFQQNSDQSNEASKYFVGVEWQATAATSGSFLLGYQRKEYDFEQFRTVSGLSYVLDLIWEPNSFTEVSIAGSRRPRESAQVDVGGFFSTNYSLGVEHEITPRVQVISHYKLAQDDVVTSVNRTDERQEFNIGVTYVVNRWLHTSLRYEYSQRKSDIESFNFNANVVELLFTSKFN